MSRMSRVSWCAILVLLGPASRADAFPEIGDESVVDHGYRYPSPPSMSRACAVATADSAILLAYDDGGRIAGYRRSASGGEIDVNRIPLADGDWQGSFDLSPDDGTGWKLAFVAGGLYVRNLDRRTLQPTGADGAIPTDSSRAVRSPILAWTGERHLLAWTELGIRQASLHLARVRPDLSLEDASPVRLADRCQAGPIALAADSAGGIVIWFDEGRRLMARILGRDGLPTGEALTIATPEWSSRMDLDACRLGDGWLVAWLDRDQAVFAWLDAAGESRAPGAGEVGAGAGGATSLAIAPVRSDAVDPAAALLWRGVGVNVSRVRPSPGGWLRGHSAACLRRALRYIPGLGPRAGSRCRSRGLRARDALEHLP